MAVMRPDARSDPTQEAGPGELRERHLRVGTWQTRALEVSGRGPVHVLLHGYADSADTWRLVIERLARAGKAAAALDLPGFARADPLADDEPVLSQLEGFARAAVRHYAGRGRRVVLVGNSLGGSAALLAAVGGEQGLSAIVPVAPAGFDMARWIYRLETFTLLRLLLRLPPTIPRWMLQGIVALIYRQLAIHRQGAVRDDVVRRFAAHFADRATVTRYLGVADRLAAELGQPFALEGIDVPVLLVWGRQDRMLWHRNAQLVLSAVPHARLETIERCGHCPQIECPERTAELILSAGRRRSSGLERPATGSAGP